MRTDINACDSTWGCTDTVRESALKVDPGRKIPCSTGESNLRRQRAGLMIDQLSHTLIPFLVFFVANMIKTVASATIPEPQELEYQSNDCQST